MRCLLQRRGRPVFWLPLLLTTNQPLTFHDQFFIFAVVTESWGWQNGAGEESWPSPFWCITCARNTHSESHPIPTFFSHYYYYRATCLGLRYPSLPCTRALPTSSARNGSDCSCPRQYSVRECTAATPSPSDASSGPIVSCRTSRTFSLR